MDGLSKLGGTLTAVFAVLVAALFAELLYVLWRRKRFRRRSLGGGGQDSPLNPCYGYSKELLYLLCWKNKSRVEPDAAPPQPGNGGTAQQPAEAVDELEKWKRLYGPSRMLFTIREEEREGLESDYSSSAEKGTKTRTVSLDDGFGLVLGSAPDVALKVDDEDEEATPFSTPCASPPYYTPSPSPAREAVDGKPESPTFKVQVK